MTKQYPLKYADEFPRHQNLWRLICKVKVRQVQGDASVFSFQKMLKKRRFMAVMQKHERHSQKYWISQNF